jgi:putative transposase
VVDALVEDVGISEGLVGEMMGLEVTPDDLDVVEFGCIFRQPLDGEPMGTLDERGPCRLADVDRAVASTMTTGLRGWSEPRNLLQKGVSPSPWKGWTMKPSRFTEEWIIGILREQEAGAATADVCRKHGISSATFYKWKAKYGGLEVSDAKRLKALEDENAKLKKLLAEAMLDNAMLKDVASKKW